MKKILLTGILSILFVGFSFAQTRIGITAGLNVSNFTGDVSDNKYKAGFQAGVIADFGITQNFSIMPELLFSQRGYKVDSSVKSEGVELDISGSETLNYLQLPVNLAYKFNAGYGSKVFIFAGPYFGYALSGKEGSDKLNIGSGENDAVKAFDFGVNVGVGYEYQKIFFKLQFNPGLMNINNYEGASIKNTNLAVSVGYFFN